MKGFNSGLPGELPGYRSISAIYHCVLPPNRYRKLTILPTLKLLVTLALPLIRQPCMNILYLLSTSIYMRKTLISPVIL